MSEEKEIYNENGELINGASVRRVLAVIREPDKIRISVWSVVQQDADIFHYDQSVDLKADELQDIYNSLAGIFRGRITGDQMRWNQCREQLYCQLREQRDLIEAIGKGIIDTDTPELATLIRAIAVLMTNELDDRFVSCNE